MQGYKSADTAGILGITLGGLGVMDFYLGNYRKAAVHVGLLMLVLTLLIVEMIVLPLSCLGLEWSDCAGMNAVIEVLIVIVVLGNFLWGVAEGIVVLIRGDDGLVSRGYRISNSRVQAKGARSVTVERKAEVSSFDSGAML